MHDKAKYFEQIFAFNDLIWKLMTFATTFFNKKVFFSHGIRHIIKFGVFVFKAVYHNFQKVNKKNIKKHTVRFKSFPICSFSYNNNTLKI